MTYFMLPRPTSAGERADSELDLTVVGARDRDGAAHGQPELGYAGFARSFDPRDAIDRHDVAAVNPQERFRIEARLKRADRERAEIFLLAVVDIGVVGVGADGVDVADGDVSSAPILLDPDRGGPSDRRRDRRRLARRAPLGTASARDPPRLSGDPASTRAGAALRGSLASGTSERRKAPDTPNATTVASSASVLRDSADSAPTKRETS